MRKGRLNIVAIVLLGMILALALGAFAHAITDRTVALPATTLSAADEPLAPVQAKRARPVAAPKKKPKSVAPRTIPTTTTTAPTAGTTTDDHGGDDRDRGRGRDRGSDDSSGSGSGSDDSGSGSGRSGSGHDDD
jgi:hypothetical protein